MGATALSKRPWGPLASSIPGFLFYLFWTGYCGSLFPSPLGLGCKGRCSHMWYKYSLFRLTPESVRVLTQVIASSASALASFTCFPEFPSLVPSGFRVPFLLFVRVSQSRVGAGGSCSRCQMCWSLLAVPGPQGFPWWQE